MKDYRSLSHTKWDCKYHVVFILQVSRCVHPEVPTQTYLRKAEGSPRGDTP